MYPALRCQEASSVSSFTMSRGFKCIQLYDVMRLQVYLVLRCQEASSVSSSTISGGFKCI